MIFKPAQSTPRLDAPYFPEVGVLGLVPDDWEGVWQPRHQVLSRLSRYFNVVWISPAREWREIWLSRQGWKATPAARQLPRPSFMVYRPGKLLPRLYKPRFLASLLAQARLKQAKRLLVNRGCRKVILYLWRPEYEEALDLVPHDLSCYHIDDEYSFSVVEQPVSDSEARLISRVNQVFIHSPALLKKKGSLNSHTQFVPNGVDYHAYATPRREPEDLKAIAHPRIGYVGRIKSQLDIDLLLLLARRHREWSFVLVGPRGQLTHRDVQLIDELKQIPNVHFLGGKPVDMLPAYTQHMDVCILNYRVNDYTKYIYPLKLHEYLATGRPVVGSPINSLLQFCGAIALARTAEEWSQALSEALRVGTHSDGKGEARQRTARRYDWGGLVHMIARTICEQLGAEYRARIAIDRHSEDYHLTFPPTLEQGL